jgi:GDPmannose 4,6-dehydratase
VAKQYAFWIVVNYREAYGMFATNGILFNHESPRRGPTFVTRKITLGLMEWHNSRKPIELGNLDAKRDWGHAQDYVEAMWRMLQQPEPQDFVIGTGETHSIRDFIKEAISVMGLDIVWEGSGVDEVGKDGFQGNVVVRVNPEFYRPAEVDVLIADATKAREVLGWTPKISFKELVKRMMTNDFNASSVCRT